MRRLRILALHGYHGSGAILRSQMRALADALAPLADFVYADAPALAAGDFGWWHAEGDGGSGVGARPLCYRGWSRTRDWFTALCASDGPFDGVFGFSQGAALAALLVGLCALDGPGRLALPCADRRGRGPGRLDFAIMVGGFPSGDARHAPLYAALAGRELPSLHIIGRSDGVVPPARSAALAAHFAGAERLEHDGGHVVPSTARVRQATADFLTRMAQRQWPERSGRSGATATATAAATRRSTGAPSSLEVPLWPGRAHPAMRLVFPDGDRAHVRPALLVFRGGGYSTCHGSGEGSAEWAAAQGLVGVEVEYGTRSSNQSYPANYQDAARAVRLVRHHAKEWGVDPRRVGVVGYSAGGHLASLLSTQPTLSAAAADDLATQVSARPDLVVLAYPLISFVDGYGPGAFVGSVDSFFGERDVSETRRRQFSNELHVAAGHPPVFLWTTADDRLVPASHSQLFAAACRRAGVPVTFELFAHGPHGMGLALGDPSDVGRWTAQLRQWLGQQWGSW